MKATMTKEIRVSGKPHPDGKVWKFNLVVDYTGANIDDVQTDAFAHNIVQIQNGILRPSTAAELDAIVANGEYRIEYANIKKGRKPADPIKAATAKFETMSPTEQLAFIAELQKRAAKLNDETTDETTE